MRLTSCLTLTALILSAAAAVAQDKTPAKAPEPRTLKVKLNYTGTGTVDDKHHIIVFLFDSPDFMKGEGMPISEQSAAAKDGTVTFSDVDKSPVYVSTVFDPSGQYDGMSQPPSGASLGVYSKTPGEASPVNIEPGKTAEIEIAFDDSSKMP
ncbi:MAG TPA: hypothetical protein VFA04_08065 [Bryobacteraceae bacterium]|nr:hypothetical protein [Bryobacteraceae bacterium]